MGKKPKRKQKGKKCYKNTHGNWYRVRLNYKRRHKNTQNKILREIKKQTT
jgi:hypothetical protein